MSKSTIVNYLLPPEKEKMIDISREWFYYICHGFNEGDVRIGSFPFKTPVVLPVQWVSSFQSTLIYTF